MATRGKDALGPTKPQRDRRRRMVHVFSEGKVTEPKYIEIIRGMDPVYKNPAMKVEVRIENASAPGSDRKPIKLVEAAVAFMRKEAREAKRHGLKKDLLPQVWCLFDRDQHESVEQALKEADKAGVKVAFSHPCFEIWRLLHHKPVTNTFGGVCGEATKGLPFAKTSANIKVVQPDEIKKDSYQDAKKRALKMNAEHGDHVLKSQRDPYTDVHDFIEQGLGIISY